MDLDRSSSICHTSHYATPMISRAGSLVGLRASPCRTLFGVELPDQMRRALTPAKFDLMPVACHGVHPPPFIPTADDTPHPSSQPSPTLFNPHMPLHYYVPRDFRSQPRNPFFCCFTPVSQLSSNCNCVDQSQIGEGSGWDQIGSDCVRLSQIGSD